MKSTSENVENLFGVNWSIHEYVNVHILRA